MVLGLRYEDSHYKHLGHKTSEVSKLLPAVLHEPVDPEIALLVTNLETRASNSRYPSPVKAGAGEAVLAAPAVTISESAKEVADAERLLGWCDDRVGRALRATASMAP